MTDMATVYGTFANQGERVDLNPILEVKDPRGNILEQKKKTVQKVIDPAAAFIISDILSDNQARSMAFGTNSPLVIDGHTVSVKTGTSDNKRDNWTIGYTPSFVVAVWVGNNDNSPMDPSLTSGITGAAPIWHEIMNNLLLNKPDEKQTIPSNIVTKNAWGEMNTLSKEPIILWIVTEGSSRPQLLKLKITEQNSFYLLLCHFFNSSHFRFVLAHSF